MTLSAELPSEQALPPGVHPYDQTGPEFSPAPAPQGQTFTTGTKAFSVPHAEAIPVWERATTNFATKNLTLGATTQVAGRLPGRKSVTLWVPGTAAQGVQFSNNRGDVDSGNGTPLSPGDSVTIGSEAAVWAGPLSGQTSGTVYTLDLYNALAD